MASRIPCRKPGFLITRASIAKKVAFCAEPHQRVRRSRSNRSGVRVMVGVIEWYRGKRILIVDEDYHAASRLETRLLHHGAFVVGPASSLGEALGCVMFEKLDAAVLGVTLGSGTTLPIADALTRLAIPFVFLSRRPTDRVPERFGNLIFNEPGDDRVIARLLAEDASARQDNVVDFAERTIHKARQ